MDLLRIVIFFPKEMFKFNWSYIQLHIYIHIYLHLFRRFVNIQFYIWKEELLRFIYFKH